MAKKPKLLAGTSSEIRGVDLAEVERVLAFMHKHGLAEFEYERRGVRIRLKKELPMAAAGGVAAASSGAGAPLATGGGAVSAAAPEAPARAPEAAEEELHLIKSPIVGTFYAAAAPEADPFVRVGARVERGQVLCIIEAMKLMNEIESDVAGEVARIFVENGNPVEYGEALFAIRPAKK